MKISVNLAALALVSFGSIGLGACGGSTPAPADTTSDAIAPTPAAADSAAAEEPSEPVVAQKSFDDMSPPERMELMKKVVVPQMTEALQSFDAEEFAKVSCVTCHGPGAKDGDFGMPSKALPALNEAEMKSHPEMTQFMKETVVPKMAAILGEQPYDPETHQGFGCFHCHTKKD